PAAGADAVGDLGRAVVAARPAVFLQGPGAAFVPEVLVHQPVAVVVLEVAHLGLGHRALADEALRSEADPHAGAAADPLHLVRAGLAVDDAVVDEAVAVVVHAVAHLLGGLAGRAPDPPDRGIARLDPVAGPQRVRPRARALPQVELLGAVARAAERLAVGALAGPVGQAAVAGRALGVGAARVAAPPDPVDGQALAALALQIRRAGRAHALEA